MTYRHTRGQYHILWESNSLTFYKTLFARMNNVAAGNFIDEETGESLIHYELGVKDFTFHSLRHTHATMLAEAGMPQKYTQQRLGHKDISVTLKYYTHLTDKMSEIGGKILESMFADNDDD